LGLIELLPQNASMFETLYTLVRCVDFTSALLHQLPVAIHISLIFDYFTLFLLKIPSIDPSTSSAYRF